MRSILSLALCAMFSVISLTAAEVTISLDVAPEETLPRLPVNFLIQISNSASTTIRVPAKAVLQVRRADGYKFVALSVTERSSSCVLVLGEDPTGIELRAGEKRDVSVFSTLATPWMCDTRLTSPGEYELQLVVSDELQDVGLQNSEDVIAKLGLQQYLVSSKANLRVSTPSGDDAKVYEMIQDEPCMWATTYARQVWSRYPNSRYAAYAPPLPDNASIRDTIDALELAHSRGPSRTVAENMEFSIARKELEKHFGVRAGRVSLDDALAAIDRAEKILRTLTAQAQEPSLRRAAAAELEELPSREALRRDARVARGEIVDIIPTVRCLSLEGDKQTVWFGFRNSNRESVEIPVGARNQFTPGGANQGQPTTFKRGAWARVFGVVPKGPELTWHLDKTNLVVKVRELETCAEVERELEEKN
ncbi:MAG: hypothetical protein ACYC7A_13020 [Thermoanaerobaculia bacterium]